MRKYPELTKEQKIQLEASNKYYEEKSKRFLKGQLKNIDRSKKIK